VVERPHNSRIVGPLGKMMLPMADCQSVADVRRKLQKPIPSPTIRMRNERRSGCIIDFKMK
jgi:hypothetical protein